MNDLSQLRLTRDKAKALLDDEAFDQALARMKDDVIGQLVDPANGATDKKLELIGQLKAVMTFKPQLEALIRDYAQAKAKRDG
jgi:hypothetical protein